MKIRDTTEAGPGDILQLRDEPQHSHGYPCDC
jgi:hypothetical protein